MPSSNHPYLRALCMDAQTKKQEVARLGGQASTAGAALLQVILPDLSTNLSLTHTHTLSLSHTHTLTHSLLLFYLSRSFWIPCHSREQCRSASTLHSKLALACPTCRRVLHCTPILDLRFIRLHNTCHIVCDTNTILAKP